MVAAVQAYPLSQNPLKVQRNVSTYALWPLRWVPGRGYIYLWACGHEDAMPHVCPKGPDRATLFQAPDLRLVRPAWTIAQRFIDRHRLQDAEAGEALKFARERVGGRKVA